jgi:hypothetical protein
MNYLDTDWIAEAYERIWKMGENPLVKHGELEIMSLSKDLTQSPVLVRKEYLALWECIKDLSIPSLLGSGGIVVIGQSGAGG